MPRIVRVHNNANTNIKGVAISDIINPTTMFDGVHDPLLDGGSNLAAKAGSSIPSMFARMIFFSTAFASIKDTNVNQGAPVPVYNELVSQCFDLLEMVFNKASGLGIMEINFADQINNLNNSSNPQHQNFANVLRQQCDLSLSGLQSIYLFTLNNTIVGGTSPFSVVFTSPNWISGKPVISLTQRDGGFKTFVYKMMTAYNSGGRLTKDMEAFYNYVKACMDAENVGFANYTIDKFETEYPALIHNEATIYVNTQNMTLRQRPTNNFSSDFFIKATKMPFDVNRTPLALVKGQHPNMYYYDKAYWQQNQEVPQVERMKIEERDLPGCTAYRHDYFTEVDIFEERLLALPFPINVTKFGYDIPINDGNELYHAMLPIKPLLLKFFGKEDLENMLTVTCNEQKCDVVLDLPVFNGSTREFTLKFKKSYYFDRDVDYIDEPGLDTSLNVGISPFYKDTQTNDYWVMGAIEQDSNCDINLRFFKHGCNDELPTRIESARGSNPLTKYYNIPDFDFIQIEIIKNGISARCLAIPFFDNVVNGTQQYYYGVDFGTTNTHIAYYSQTGSGSFSESEFANFACFINLTTTTVHDVTTQHEDKLRVVKARQFYPQTTNQNHYQFPIRTAINHNGKLAQNPIVFKDASIGFHYVKEIVAMPDYKTDVKWSFLNNVANAEAANSVTIFFTQILYMIKHHWMMERNADKNLLPQIKVTFPGTDNHRPSITKWNEAYYKVFHMHNVVDNNVAGNYQAPISGMVESLAPCVKLLGGDISLQTSGFLNVDIGGGTTDLQYYKNTPNQNKSFYDSVLFAGDDLWGQGFENMAPIVKYAKVQPNNFTNLANSKLGKSNITIDGGTKDITNITLTGKELINCLFRDENKNFENVLSDTNPDNQVRKCRLQMLLHYSAIVYHTIHWLTVNEADMPKVIKMSGLGSRYLSLLFQNKEEATNYTKYIIEHFQPTITLPNDFEVRISDPNVNPKTITAEGAAQSLAINYNLSQPQIRRHLGLTNYTMGSNITVGQLNDSTIQTESYDYFNKFVDDMQSVNFNNLGGNLHSLPYLSPDEAQAMKNNGKNSILTIITAYYNDVTRHNQNLEQSLFFWSLKDSLWRL